MSENLWLLGLLSASVAYPQAVSVMYSAVGKLVDRAQKRGDDDALVRYYSWMASLPLGSFLPAGNNRLQARRWHYGVLVPPTLLKLRRYDEAIRYGRSLLKKVNLQNQVYVRYAIANAMEKLGDPGRADAERDAGDAAMGEAADTWTQCQALGDVAMERGNIPKAAMWYERSLTLVPGEATATHAHLHQRRAALACLTRDMETAAQHAHLGLACNLGNALLTRSLLAIVGDSCLHFERWKDAEHCYRQALSLAVIHGDAAAQRVYTAVLAVAALLGGDAEAARLETLAQLPHPLGEGAGIVRGFRSYVLQVEGDDEGAFAVLEPLFEADLHPVPWINRLLTATYRLHGAQILIDLEQADNAVKLAESCRGALEGQRHQGMLFRSTYAWALAAAGRVMDARRELADVPTDRDSLPLIGQALLLLEDNEQALETFRSLRSRSTSRLNDSFCDYLSGECLVKLGRRSEAVESFQRVVDVNTSVRYTPLARARLRELLVS